MAKFKAGTTYRNRTKGDSKLFATIKVVSRTESTATVTGDYKGRYKIHKMDGEEFLMCGKEKQIFKPRNAVN